MKNTFGNAVTVTLFGESHGKAVGAVIDGLSPGIPIDEEYISGKPTEKYLRRGRKRMKLNLSVGCFKAIRRGRHLLSLLKTKIPKVKTTAAGCIFRGRRMLTTPGIASMADTKIIAEAGIFREESLRHWLLPGP